MSLDEKSLKKLGATVSIGGVVSVGALFGILDQRYAQANDLESLVTIIKEERVDRLEFEIEDVQRTVRYILSIPEEARTAFQNQELLQAQQERDYLLRKMERIQSND